MPSKSSKSKRRARAQPTLIIPPPGPLPNMQRPSTTRMMEKRVLNNHDIATAVDAMMDGTEVSTPDLALTSRQWDEAVRIAKELGLNEEEAVARVIHHYPEFQPGEREDTMGDKDFRNRVLVHRKRRAGMAKKAKFKAEKKRRRATDHPPPTDAGISVDASSQLPQLAHNKTHTNNELDTKVPASPPSPSIADTVPQCTPQGREASPPIAPVPQSERAQLAERPPRLRGGDSERTRSQIISPNLRLLREAIQRLSDTIDRELQASGLTRADLLGQTGPSTQRVSAKTLQKDEKRSEVTGTTVPTKNGPIGPPACKSALHPRSNEEPLAATTEANETSGGGKPNPAEEVPTKSKTTQVEQEPTFPQPVFPFIRRSGAMERMREAKRMLYERWPDLAIPADGVADANSKGKDTGSNGGRGVRVERSKRARDENDEDGSAMAKKPRTSLGGQTSGLREVSAPVERNVDEGEAAAVDAKASTGNHQAAAALAIPKQEWVNVNDGAAQQALDKVKAEPVEDSGVKDEPQSDVVKEALLKDEGGDQVLSTSIPRLRLPALLHGRALKDEGDLADSKLYIGAGLKEPTS